MATITFDRVNRYVIVGYLHNQFSESYARMNDLSALVVHNGELEIVADPSPVDILGDASTVFYPSVGGYLEQTSPSEVIGGETYTVSFYAKVMGGNGSGLYQAEIEWYDSGFNFLSSDFSPTVDLYGMGWVRMSLTATAPFNAISSVVELYYRGGDSILGQDIVMPTAFDSTDGLPPWDDDEWMRGNGRPHIHLDAGQFEVGSAPSDWHAPSQTDTSVTIQELYEAIVDFQDNSTNLNMEQVCSAEGKADLGGGKLTVVTLKMLNGWKVKFTDRFNEPTTLCTIEDGNFVGDGYFPLEASEYVFSVISQATTGALVPGQGAADDGTAAAVWSEDLSTYNVTGSAGDILREIVANAAAAVWDEALASHLVAGSTGEKLDSITAAPSAADIADAVWDEAQADHLTPGSTGESLDDAGAAGDPGAVWDELMSGHSVSGSFGARFKKLLTLAKFLGLKDS